MTPFTDSTSTDLTSGSRLSSAWSCFATVEQMDRARPARGETDAELAGILRMRASHERGLLFVPNLHEVDRVAGLGVRLFDARQSPR
jgi:hypothetical protein